MSLPKVINLHPDKDPDQVLENAKGQFKDVLILGWIHDDELAACSSELLSNTKEVVWLIENIKYEMIHPHYFEVQPDD